MAKAPRLLPASLWIFLAALLVFNLAISTVLAQPVVRVNVLIAFNRQPGPPEQALVRRAGGDIKYTYSLVSAIAASLPEAAIEGLRHNPNVTVVELDGQVQVADAELDNTWGVQHIGAGVVHASGNRGGGVRVGVLDTGIDTDHPDLSYDPACSASFVASETLEDGHGHGTHVAGTVAALDNGTGVVGMAPQATLCIYKVLNNSGVGSYSDIIAALERAVADGVQVTNNSYGGSGDPGVTVRAAFDNAYAAGLLHVAAAGNIGNPGGTGENCFYPARWDSVIATAATTQSDARAGFSSTCPEVELAAPGDQINSTLPGGGYGLLSGTSMASPHVAGSAALVLAANPGWSSDQVRLQLQATTTDLGDPGRDARYGYGLVNTQAATGLTNSAPLADDQALTTAEDTPTAITLTGSDPVGDALTFSVVSGPAHGALSGAAPNLSYTPAANYNGLDSFTFVVNDGTVDSNLATVSVTVSPVNDAPVANGQAVTTAEDTARAITLTGSDPDGGALTFTVVNGPAHGALSGAASNLIYTPAANYNGADSFSFVVNDGVADSNLATVSLTVSPVNDAPIANGQAVTTAANTRRAITLTGSDPDGDALIFSVVGGPSHGALSGAAPNLTYTPNASYSGADSFTFIASDGQSGSAAATVSVSVTDGVTITKATYTSRRKSLDVEASTTARGGVSLTATAYDAGGKALGSVAMSYNAKRDRHLGTISGLAAKPFRVVVTSGGGGSASVQGAAIGG